MSNKSLAKRTRRMLKVDFRRMFTMPFVYILIGICVAMPILILVMTTMMDGSVRIDPQTGVETVVEGFDNVWQIIGTVSGEGGMGMSMTGMCNINMLCFLVAVLVGIFVTEDFKSGYAKNIFAIRAKKGDYVASKTLVCIVCGMLMFLGFFAGAMVGGAIAGLPFNLGSASVPGVVMCMLSKLLLVAVMVPIDLLWSVVGRQRTWVSLVGSLCTSMLFFMM
ncbi:MAG: ABC transporter permease, partial [Candidatus Faecivicinus sp.]